MVIYYLIRLFIMFGTTAEALSLGRFLVQECHTLEIVTISSLSLLILFAGSCSSHSVFTLLSFDDSRSKYL